MNIEESRALAAGFQRGVYLVTYYLKERVNPLQDGLINPQNRENSLRGLFLRALAWMLSLEKLDNATDFQPIFAATRGMLEITVDMVLLHHDKTTESAWKMHWWGESAKLKHAEALVNYYNRAGVTVPNHHQVMVDFIQNNKPGIDHMRLTLWPYTGSDPKKVNKPRHPDRWTDRNLLADTHRADQLEGTTIKQDLGMLLEEFYETEFRQLCWGVHGSGLVSVRGFPEESFFLMCGLGYKWCGDLAMFCGKLILEDFGFSTYILDLKKEWQDIKVSRGFAYLEETGGSINT